MSNATTARGNKTRAMPQMNVTPLVDVVLVLLIIFMVVTPLLTKQFWLQLPKNETSAEPPSDNKSVVLTVRRDGSLAINGTDLAKETLTERVARVMAARTDKVLYFDAADDAPYAVTVDAMDRARQGGAKTIAILTNEVMP